MIKRFVKKVLPSKYLPSLKILDHQLRLSVQNFQKSYLPLFNSARDVFEELSGRRDPLQLPKRYTSVVGHGDGQVIGNKFLQYFIDFGGLKPDDSVLDCGCGVGRMAIPLTKYPNEP